MTDPFRGTSPRSRFSITVDGEQIEGDRFADIIVVMRERGACDGDINLAARLVLDQPRGARMQTIDAVRRHIGILNFEGRTV